MAPFQAASYNKGCTDDNDKCEEWSITGECEYRRRCCCCAGTSVHSIGAGVFPLLRRPSSVQLAAPLLPLPSHSSGCLVPAS